jgi:hypothetical protein
VTRAFALAAGAALAAAALAGCTTEAPPVDRDVAPAGFAAVLDDEVGPVTEGRATWTTFWDLTWEEVAGAAGYVVWYGTSEGDSIRTRELDEPRLRLSVATGTTTPEDRVLRRDQELTLTAAQLSVRVAARFPDGELGPPSPWLTVGEPIPPARAMRCCWWERRRGGRAAGSPAAPAPSRGCLVSRYSTTMAVTMPNMPSGDSAWLRMWQWKAQVPGSVARTRTSMRWPGATGMVSAV